MNRALEASIHIGLAALLTAACLLILLPFIPLIAWGIIIAVAAFPIFKKLQAVIGGRGGWAAALFTLLLLAILTLPVLLLARSMVEGLQTLTAHVKAGLELSYRHLPASKLGQSSAFLRSKPPSPACFRLLPEQPSPSCNCFSILLSGVLLANAWPAYELTRRLANRFFGKRGPEIQHLVGSTIRSVTTGILGVAMVQSVFAALGFLVVGLPGAGLWAVIFLVAAVLQVGILVLIPAVIYAFVIASTTKAVIFLIWCIIVALMDNILKPIMLGVASRFPSLWFFWARSADSWRWESLACSSVQSFCQWATSYSSRGLREQLQSSEAFPLPPRTGN